MANINPDFSSSGEVTEGLEEEGSSLDEDIPWRGGVEFEVAEDEGISWSIVGGVGVGGAEGRGDELELTLGAFG